MLKSLFLLSLVAILSVQAYDEKLAFELLRASTASYCQKQHLTGMTCGDACNSLKGYNFHHQHLFSLTALESVSYSLFVNHDTKRVVAAFRGTNGLSQLTLSLGSIEICFRNEERPTEKMLMKEALQSKAVTYNLHPIKNCVVTQYFYQKYISSLRADFMGNLRYLVTQHQDYEFLFTGHSLGGAFATHAALDVALSNIIPRNQMKLYSFGSPRVGDYNFASAVSNTIQSFRVTNKHDVVPHLPPCLPNLLRRGCAQRPNHPNENGFLVYHAYHVWPEVFYSGNGHKICSEPEDLSCANQYKVPFLYIADHLNYLGVSTSCLSEGAVKIEN